MTRLPWFRLYDEIIDDIKIMKQSERIRWNFIEIMCCINRQNRENGRVPSEDDLTFLLRRNRGEIDTILKDLLKVGLIKKDKYGYYSQAFNKRQFKSDNISERTKRFRERSKEPPLTESYTESESYTDKEQIKNSIVVKKKDCNNNNEVAAIAADLQSVVLKSKRVKTEKQDKSFIIDFLKKLGIPGNISYEYTKRYPVEYLCRKIFLLEYYKSNGTKVKNDIAFLRSAIEYDNEKFPEYDDFHEWFKMRKEQIMDDNNTPHQLKQIIGRT